MSRKINPNLTTRPKVEVNEKVRETLRSKQADSDATDTSTGASHAGAKPGVSDAAAGRTPGSRDGGLPDLGGTSEQTQLGGESGGSSGGGVTATGSAGPGPGAFVGAPVTGAHGVIADAQAALSERFGAGVVTEGRQEVDPEQAIAEAEAGMPSHQWRESANSMLFDDAAEGDGTTGIAEQGDGSISEERDTSWSTKEGRRNWVEDILGGKNHDSAPGVEDGGAEGVKQTVKTPDATTTDPTASTVAGLFTSNLAKGEEQTQEHVTTTPEGTQIVVSPNGTKTMTMTNDKVVIVKPDGTKTVREADGSTTTLHPNGEVTETPPKPPKTDSTPPDAGQPGAERPDPEGTDERFRWVSEGLKDRLGPKGVEGDGDIDFGDDIPFGVGAGATIHDTQGRLLGDAGRAGGVVEGPATSGVGPLDPSGNGGAIDPIDEEDGAFGGGLEDDPLAGSGPSRGLDGFLTDDDESATGSTDGTDDADSTGDGADDGASDDGSV